MTDPLNHLRSMKRRLTQPSKPGNDMSASEKVNMLEQTLSLFRAEVDMKLKIMQQILTTRNEQVTAHKKLLEREQTLYSTLLGQWKDTSKLASTGLTMPFSAGDIGEDYEEEMNNSDSDYMEGPYFGPGPAPKKSKSTLRRQRKSGKTIPKSNPGVYDIQNRTDNNPSTASAFSNEWDDTESDLPPVQVQMKSEADEGGMNEFEDFDEDYTWDPTSQGGGEADKTPLEYVKSARGSPLLLYQGFLFRKEKVRGTSTYWICIKGGYENCRARCSTFNGERVVMTGVHNHFSDPVDIEKRQRRAELKEKAWKLQNHANNTIGFGFSQSSASAGTETDTAAPTTPTLT